MPKNADAARQKQAQAVAAPDAQADKADSGATGGGTESPVRGPSGGAFFYQNKDKAGYDASSIRAGPAEFPFESFPAHAATWRVFLRL